MLIRILQSLVFIGAAGVCSCSSAPLTSDQARSPSTAAVDSHESTTRPDPPMESRLRPVVQSFRDRSGAPGVSIGFVLPDGTAGVVAEGLADVERDVAMTPSHRLPAGSAGKAFVAAAAMLLHERGMLDLDSALSEHLGDRPWFDRLPNARSITIRMLMNHTSGVPEHVLLSEFAEALRDQPDREWKPDELVAFVLDKPAVFPAGAASQWSYADTNYILLGMVIEEITEQDIYTLIDTTILKQRGLDDIVPQDRRDLPMLACGYMQPGRSLIEIDDPRTVIDGRFFINPQFEWCGGGFIATPGDLARWTHLLWSGDTVLKENSRELMIDGVAANTGRGQRYGLGVQIRPTGHGLTFGHGGYFPGSMTETAYFVEHGIAMAVMVNSDHHTSPASLLRFLDECMDALLNDRASMQDSAAGETSANDQ